MSDVTQIMDRIKAGDGLASQDLLPLVYSELRDLAVQRMARERSDHTLQATALVHEAYVRLVDKPQTDQWTSKGHFFAAAAEAMRRILIEHARQRNSLKRGGQLLRVELTNCGEESSAALTMDEVLELDEALSKLEIEDTVVAELVKLRLYAGLSVSEAGKVLEISRSTAYEYWDYALAWFNTELH